MILPNPFNMGIFELGLVLSIALLLISLVFAIWAYRDMRRRSRSVGWAIASFLLVLLLPIIGLITYLLLRPPDVLANKYDRALKQEVLLQQIEANLICPGCSRAVQPNWMVCPECHVTLHRACTFCGTSLDLHWTICPVCTQAVESVDRRTTDEPATS